jgi:hypothetical protein
MVAGKNAIINGDFSVWQRGTTFTIGASGYDADRWQYAVASAVPTGTITQQTFTPGTAPVSGYEGTYYKQYLVTANNGCTLLQAFMKMEDVRLFANQTVTLSFWAKADATSTATVTIGQNFGSGGSAEVDTAITSVNGVAGNNIPLTSSWQRFTCNVTLPSIAGKTIGTSSSLILFLNLPSSGSNVRNGTYSFWGFQLEAGSTATQFTTATGTIQGELAACQRYYWQITSSALYNRFAFGFSFSTTGASILINAPVSMRATPSAAYGNTLALYNTYFYNLTSISAPSAIMSNVINFNVAVASGLTAYTYYQLIDNSGTAYLALSSEL